MCVFVELSIFLSCRFFCELVVFCSELSVSFLGLVVAKFSADGFGLFQTGFVHNCAGNFFDGMLSIFDVESDATLLQAGPTSSSIACVQYLGVLNAEFPKLMSKSGRLLVLLEVCLIDCINGCGGSMLLYLCPQRCMLCSFRQLGMAESIPDHIALYSRYSECPMQPPEILMPS